MAASIPIVIASLLLGLTTMIRLPIGIVTPAAAPHQFVSRSVRSAQSVGGLQS